LAKASEVKLTIFDLNGKLVKQIMGSYEAGIHQV